MAPREAGATYAAAPVLSSKPTGAGTALGTASASRIQPAPSLSETIPMRSDAMSADQSSILRILQAASAAGAAGRSHEAEELLAQATRLAPEHPAVLNQRGLLLMQRGEPAGARELFQRATGADAGHPALWSNLAASLDALGLYEEEMAGGGGGVAT